MKIMKFTDKKTKLCRNINKYNIEVTNKTKIISNIDATFEPIKNIKIAP